MRPSAMSARALPSSTLRRVLNARFSGKTLIYVQIIYVFIAMYLVSGLGMTSALLYVTDLINVLCLLSCPKGSWKKFCSLGNGGMLAIFMFFCASLMIGDLMNAVDPLLIFWGVRNSFRFFVFMYCCAVMLEVPDVKRIMGLLLFIMVPNVFLSLIQYSQGFDGDQLGGVFGTVVGVNGYSNVLFCILLAYSSLKYAYGKGSLLEFCLVASATLGLSALAEIKLFYIEAALIIVFSFFCRANRVRSYLMIGIVLIAFIGALQLFALVFPSAYEMLTNFDKLLGYSTDNTGAVQGYEISRLNAFSDINQFIFQGRMDWNLFGIGFGSSGYSKMSFLTGAFYKTYHYLNYYFFTHQTWFIETGYVGFALLLSVFLSFAVYSGKICKRLPEDAFLFRFVQITVYITVLCFWYNQSIRIEAAYITFFVFSIPFVIYRERMLNRGDSNVDKKNNEETHGRA